MGASIFLKIPPQYLFWLTSLNPPQSFKLAVVGILHGGLEVFGMAGRYALDLFGDWFIAFFSGVLILWIVIPAALALFLFRAKCAD